MEFLKKNYEKLILLVLLVISIASMFHVLNIIKQTSEVKDSDLKIPTKEADYKNRALDDPVFDVDKTLLKTALVWVNPGARNEKDKNYYSDLTVMYAIVRCPHCGKLIPRYFMEEKLICPLCKKDEPFVKPPEPKGPEAIWPVITPDDRDGDGIPDAWEIENGLNPDNPYDSFYDPDGDGFSNLYEYLQGTNPRNARSRPMLWRRLRVVQLGKVELNFKFKGLNVVDENDPSQWEVIFTNDRGMGDFTQIGGIVEIDGKSFKILKVERKKEGDEDKSVLFLKEEDGPLTLEVVREAPVMSFEDKAVMIDTRGPSLTTRIVAKVGETFTIGDRATGREGYTVKEFKRDPHAVVLQDPNFMPGDEGDPTLDKLDLRKKPPVQTRMVVTTLGAIPETQKVQPPRPEDTNRSEFGPEIPQRRPSGR